MSLKRRDFIPIRWPSMRAKEESACQTLKVEVLGRQKPVS